MITRMLTTSVVMITCGFLVGVAHSSYRHYYRRYADAEDLCQTGPVQEVHIVGDETKTKGGRKK